MKSRGRLRRTGGGKDAPALETRRNGREIVLDCRLRALDLATAPRLLAAIEAVDLRGAGAVRLDLRAVRYADTTLVAVLVILARMHASLTVGPVSAAVADLLALHRIRDDGAIVPPAERTA